MTTETKKIPSQLTGKVRTSSGDKSITVVVENLVKHPLYGKFVKRNTKLAVHDPANNAKVGDIVDIVPCRPISKTKRWRLLRVVKSQDDS